MKDETVMVEEIKNEARELTDDELEKASGGFICNYEEIPDGYHVCLTVYPNGRMNCGDGRAWHFCCAGCKYKNTSDCVYGFHSPSITDDQIKALCEDWYKTHN